MCLGLRGVRCSVDLIIRFLALFSYSFRVGILAVRREGISSTWYYRCRQGMLRVLLCAVHVVCG